MFIPANEEKPLAWVQNVFNYRAGLDKKDIRSLVIKLGINAIYGKLAQRLGRKGQPPKYASTWYAAAITAATRRRILEAALTAPDNVVAFPTDGVYSTSRLNVDVPPTKTLGEWEFEKAKDGATFVQAGIYSVHVDDGKAG